MSRLAAGSGGGSTTGSRESPIPDARNLPDEMDPSTANLLLGVPATASGARGLSDLEFITIGEAINVTDLNERSWADALPKIAAVQAQVINADIGAFRKEELLGFSRATLGNLAQQRGLEAGGTKRQIVDEITRELQEPRDPGRDMNDPETNPEAAEDGTNRDVAEDRTGPEVELPEDIRPTSPWSIVPDASAPEVRLCRRQKNSKRSNPYAKLRIYFLSLTARGAEFSQHASSSRFSCA